MDQQPNYSDPEIPTTKHNKNKLYIILGVCLLGVLVMAGAIIGLLSLANKGGDSQKPTEPTLTVGSFPYLYACNALSRDDIKKAGADLKDDKGGEAVTASQAIPYDQTPGGRYDLAQTIEDSLLSGTVTSKCDYILSEFSSFDQKHVTVSLSQYPSVENAQKIFKTRQDTQKGTPFPSLKDKSVVAGKDASSRDGEITASILLDNRIAELKYSIGNVTEEDAPTKLDGLATTIVKNLSDTATAAKPHDFSGLGSIGDTKLIDACNALNFKKADDILGNLHYEQTKVTDDYKYGKISENSPAISSQCSVHFRYGEDDSKQPDYKKQSFGDIQTRFPNQLVLSVAAYPSATDATNAVQGLKKSKSDKAVDFSYGDTSFAYTQTDKMSGFNTTAHNFMTVKDGSVITISVIQGEVKKPYEATIKPVTTEQAKQLLDSLNLK